MRLINRGDKPPTLHGSRPGRKVAVLSGKLAQVTGRNQRARSRTGRNGHDARPAANSPLGRHRP